ncbi:MAG TPA: MFS transporter [Mycobacteriales bacterium]|nr:MFS transporter [Mycobacteriales bacterium]
MTTLAPDELPADAAGHPSAPLWRTPGLAVLFTASTSARLANEAARVAVVLLVLARTGSPALAGGLVAALTLPQLLSGPFLGAWLDRTHHRRTAFVANQVTMPAVLVALLAATGHAPGWVVLALGVAAGLTAPVLTGGFTGLIAPLVHGDSLRRAYGAESTSYNVAGVVGPSLAGALAGWVSAEAAVVAAAVLSGVALVAVLRVPMPPPTSTSTVPLARSVWEGLKHLARTPRLRAVTIATTLSFGGIGAFPVVFPSMAEEVGAEAAASGALFSAFCVGALSGSIAVAARTPKTGPLRSAVVGIFGLALVFACLAVAPSLPVALVLVALAGACEGPVVASTLTIREQLSPASMRTQVVTTAASIKFGAYALGSAVAGHVVATSGARAGVWFLAACQLAGVLLGLLALGRRTRHR